MRLVIHFLRQVEYGAVVIRRHLDKPSELQAAKFDRFDGLFRR